MFIFTLAAFSSLFLYCIALVNGTPVDGAKIEGLSDQARDILASAQPRDVVPRAEPVAPFFLVYSDRFVSGLTGPPPVADVEGFTVL